MAPPLTGRRVLLTRPRDGADALLSRLQALGAEVVLAPTIEILPPADPAPLHEALASLAAYDWLVLTSPTAARHWLQLAGHVPAWPQVAAVGEGTAAVLQAVGRTVALVAERATGADLAEALLAAGAQGPFLLARSDRAMRTLPERLQRAGRPFVEVDLYCTVTRRWDDDERQAAQGADLVLLLSPSAAQGLAEQAMDLSGATLVAIGQTTAAAARQWLGRVDAIAEPPSLDGLIAVTVTAAGA